MNKTLTPFRSTGLFLLLLMLSAYAPKSYKKTKPSKIMTTTETVTVNMEINGGQWNSVGTYTLVGGTDVTITIRNDNTNGYVIADAVQLTKPGESDIILDNADASGITTTGSWIASSHTSGYHGSDYLHDNNSGQGTKSVTYTTTVPSSGDYEISLRWTSHGNRADNVPVDITYEGGSSSTPVTGISVTPASVTIDEGQTSQLTATIAPSNASDQSVVWSTSNAAIATVDNNGLVTAVAAGSATITATSNDGGFTDSAAVTVNAVSLPSPWVNADIGNVAATGSATYANSTFTLEGSGKDIWGNTDEFQFVYQPLNGDGEIVAQVNSLTNTNAWAKAGVMIRESLDGNSKHAMSVITWSNGVSFQRRTSTGSSSSSTKIAGITAPIWVKMNRTGNVFTSSYSADGTNWTEVGNVNISMDTDVFVGLCLTSHNDGTICTAEYANVNLTTGGSSPQSQTITFNSLADKQTDDPDFTLSATASSGLPVSFSIVSGPATVSGNTVSLTGQAGTVTVRASQAGDANYQAASDVDQSFNVTQSTGNPGGNYADNITQYGATLHWDAVSGAEYNLRYRILGESNWKEETGITTTDYVFDQGTPYGKYEWQVQSFIPPSNYSGYSELDTFQTEKAVYLEGGVFKATPYNYPGVDATTKTALQAIKNDDYSATQEQEFLARMKSEIDWFVANRSVGNGGVYFESEKASYPHTMYQLIDAIAKNNSSKEGSAKNFLQAIDYHADGKTLGVDLYPSFTLKGQLPKYFYFSKFHNVLDKSYEQLMRDAIEEWTFDNKSFTRAYDNYVHTASGNPIDPLGREHPSFSAASGWAPAAKNSWVDVRATDNLKLMRECAVYLFAEEIDNTVIRDIYKQRIKNHVATLYHVGYSEWDSDPYYAHVVPPLLSLYSYTVDPDMKKIAKAGIDWYMMTGAAKYYRGTMAGPFKRVYGPGSSFSLQSASATVPYAYFGGAPDLSNKKHERDDYIIFLSDYRPPQAIYNLAHKDIPDYTEQLNTYPAYGTFNPTSATAPYSFETMYYGKNFRMGSAVNVASDWDMTPYGVTMYDSNLGAVPFLAMNAGQSAERDKVHKDPGDQIAQYKNLMIRLRPASGNAYDFVAPDYASIVQENGIWFFEYENTYVACRPVNLQLDSTKTYETDYKIYHTSPTGGTYAGFALEIVDEDQFASFASFKTAVAAQTLDISNLSNGEITLNGTSGEYLKMEYNTSNDLPKVYRNSTEFYDYTDPKNFSPRKSVTPPQAIISNVVVDGGDVTVTGTAADLNRGVVSQSWKDGTLRVIAGDKIFTSTVTVNGDVTYSEEVLNPGVNDLGEITGIELYADGQKVGDATPAEVAAGSFNFQINNLKNGFIEIKVKAIDEEGNIGWSSAQVVEITDGDAQAPAAPANLTANAISPSEVALSWDANTEPDFSVYKLYSSTVSGITPDATTYVADISGATTYTVSALQANATYYFKLTALDSALNESNASTEASASTLVETVITIDDDTYVKENDPNATFHTDGGVRVKSESGNHWNAFLKFDVSSLPSTIENAKIRMWGRCEVDKIDTDPNYLYPAVHVYAASSNWSGNTLTWNNSSNVNQETTSLDNQVVAATTYKIWYEWDVTQSLQDSLTAGVSNASFVFKANGSNDPSNHVWTVSQDWQPDNSAQLVVYSSGSGNARIASQPILKQEKQQQPEVVLYPNPVKDGIAKIGFKGFSQDNAIQLKIFNIEGKLLLDESIENTTTTYQLNTQKFAGIKGIFLVKIISGESIFNKRLIID
ncbi:Ig-like domain-containing protein [Flexithrix dorotheae]|uniref:golvesin C-terminal-like domain-containing protein n=1 Tax=Flexithrix dorotheae TaxID=70993 RepID=UPI00146B9F50|nr:Ig-like domain-containing protein [Flexithrix dorotheae]